MWQSLRHATGWPLRRPGILFLTAGEEDLARQDPARFRHAWIGLTIQSVLWGLVLVIINRGTAETDPLQKMLRLHFGAVARWPRLVQALLPLVVSAGLWMALHPLLTQFGIINRVRSQAHLAEQGLLIGVALYFTLQYFLPVFLLLHLVTSYVYLGNNPVWDIIGTTARNLLVPLRWLPLRIAKLDFGPLAGVLLILLLLHWLPNLILGRMAENNVSAWPH